VLAQSSESLFEMDANALKEQLALGFYMNGSEDLTLHYSRPGMQLIATHAYKNHLSLTRHNPKKSLQVYYYIINFLIKQI